MKQQYNGLVDIEYFCAPVIYPVTGETIYQYKKLAKNPVTMYIWTTASGKEFGNMTQGYRQTNTPGTVSIFIIQYNEIRNISADQTVTYARLVVN